MNQDLKNKIINYYTKYYRDDCCLPNFKAKIKQRLDEEKNEEIRIKKLSQKSGLDFYNKKICLIGAGTGGLAITLKQKYYSQVFGIEPNKEALAIIKEKCLFYQLDPANFNSSPAEKISFEDNKFDIVYCFTVLEHVKDIKKSLNEMIRITKPDGKIYINTPNYSYPYEEHYKIPFPTFLPKIIGFLYLIILGKSPRFLKTINFITVRKLNYILSQKTNIIWQYFYEPPIPNHGRASWLLNFFKFTLNIYSTQEIIITKK